MAWALLESLFLALGGAVYGRLGTAGGCGPVAFALVWVVTEGLRVWGPTAPLRGACRLAWSTGPASAVAASGCAAVDRVVTNDPRRVSSCGP